ncbi:MAG: glycoside hydrolase family 2 TIM barrel-domain containing protein [Bryobacteraceae bacterium]
MNRRQFVSSFGAVSGALLPAAAAAPAAVDSRSRVDLNGVWERHINGTFVDHVTVPASLEPSGYYRLKRTFLLPRLPANQRAFVHFEAINYHGRVFVNGAELGTTLPYVPAEFEITTQAREGANTVEVAIADLCPEPGGAGSDEVWLGVNPGWEGYGGIIRSAWVELRPSSFLDNVKIAYDLSSGYRTAACRVTVSVLSGSAGSARLEVTLSRGKLPVARSEKQVRLAAGSGDIEVTFDVTDPALWSPDEPNLYTLAATLTSNAGADHWTCRTGFRHLAINGPYFELNGSRILLNGMCRHDMWKDQGFTLTRSQMEQDMRAIKILGANFIRLVHYPHDRYIIDLADELGILVSEEPGFWGMDFHKMPWSRAELGLHILDRVIRRDWNAPSVMAWLLGNESEFTVDYLRQGKEMCRRLDPVARPVGIANSMRKEDAKPVCEQSGMDFFDDHPYTFDIAEFEKIAAFYGTGRPLLFTEWGGRELGQSEIIMPKTVDKLLDMTDKGVLAGHAFWSWQDLPQFSRIDAEMREGILESGVVTEGREPRQFVYAELARLFQGRRHVTLPATDGPAVLPLRHAPWSSRNRIEPVDLTPLVTTESATRTWADFENRIASHWKEIGLERQWERTGKRFALWADPAIHLLGARFATPAAGGSVRPVVLTPAFPEIEIPVGRNCTRVHFLGQVTWPGGFPLEGAPGDTVASYQLRYSDAQANDIPLRAGFEIVAANAIHEGTRIDPVATSTQRAFWFIKDWAREHYQGLLFSVATAGSRLETIHVRLSGPNPLLLFAVSTESE